MTSFGSKTHLFAFLLTAGSGAFFASCARTEWPGPAPSAIAPKPLAFPGSNVPATATDGSDPPLALDLPPMGKDHPRILITAARLVALSSLAKTSAPAWAQLKNKCDYDATEPMGSGYEGWDWSHAALELALCWKVTGRADYAKMGVIYLTALIDDKEKVSDGLGGDAVIHKDMGYSIRTHGAFGAIAYDWLHDAPTVTPALRDRVLRRFLTWAAWYKTQGYMNKQPIANYYVGYFAAVGFGGLATQGDDPKALLLRRSAREMWTTQILPAYKKVSGGGWPEGWQYGSLSATLLSMYVEAESRAPKAAFPELDGLPWLTETLAFHTHFTWPDGRHFYDNGDHQHNPPTATANELYGLMALFPSDSELGKQATFLARQVRDPKEDWTWLAALSGDPARPAEDPRRGTTSYVARGTGNFVARTDWSPEATWVALQSGPIISDHQHLDQGHFEIVRGGDGLFVDGGTYDSTSTASHNSILVNDAKEVLNYTPNQGVWGGEASTIARFEDDGKVAYALADFGAAYNQNQYPSDPRRAVTRAERELVFSRKPLTGRSAGSSRVVIYDRITVTKPSYGVTWAGHGMNAPELSGKTAHFEAGQSAAWSTTLLPAGATSTLVTEPFPKPDGSHWTNNEPAAGRKPLRLEVASPKGKTERRFLHVILVGASSEKPSVPTLIEGQGADGAAAAGEAYIFASAASQKVAAPLSYKAPSSTVRHIVVGLAPLARYAITAQASDGDSCHVAVTPGGNTAASAAGVIAFDIKGCVAQ